MIVEKARQLFEKSQEGVGTARKDVDTVLPKTNHGWKHDTDQEWQKHADYSAALLVGFREAVPRLVNLNKVRKVCQAADEDPSAFLGRLYDAMRSYGRLDPEATENARTLNTMFVGQASEDIRKKLQKQEVWASKPITDLVDLAFKVYLSRDKVEKQKDMTAQTVMLARALQGKEGKSSKGNLRRRDGKDFLGEGHCFPCDRVGHWARSCPERSHPGGRREAMQMVGQRP